MPAFDPLASMLAVQRAWTAAMAVGVLALIVLALIVLACIAAANLVDGEFWGRRLLWWGGLTRAASFALLLNAAILWGITSLPGSSSKRAVDGR